MPEINPVAVSRVRLPGVVGRGDVGVYRGLPERRDVAGGRLPWQIDAILSNPETWLKR